MNINSVSSSQYQVNLGASGGRSLSAEQTSIIEDTLSKYDANNLSQSDAQEIVKSFQEAGIAPSKALESAMSASGFDAKQVGDLAGVGRGERPMGPPPPKKEEMASVSELLQSLLGTDETDSSTANTSSFNTILDYTSKIVSLKDDAKSNVMELLNTYNSDSNQLSQEDTQKFIVNSLRQILNESDNYNTMSFYA